MSNRYRLANVDSSALTGDNVALFRDNDTKTYRVFVHKGLTYVKSGPHAGVGYNVAECMCADLSFDDLVSLSAALAAAVNNHTEFFDYAAAEAEADVEGDSA